MSEIQTPHSEQNDNSTTDNFEDILDWQAKDAAKRLVQEENQQNPDQESTGWGMDNLPTGPNKRGNRAVKIGVAAGIAAGSIFGGVAVATVQAIESAPPKPPTFSEETAPVSATDGASIYSIAESIPGNATVDTRDTVEYISSYPANIDVLKDGLQVGEQLEVPISINGVEASDE